MIIQYLEKVIFWRNIISYLISHRICYFDFLSNLFNLLNVFIFHLYLLLFQFVLDLILFLIYLYVVSIFLLNSNIMFTFYLSLFDLHLLSICVTSNFNLLNMSPACLLLQLSLIISILLYIHYQFLHLLLSLSQSLNFPDVPQNIRLVLPQTS
jgi:hypothetical protein